MPNTPNDFSYWELGGKAVGFPSQKVIDTIISIPASTTWYSDVIDLDQYGALGVIARSSRISAPAIGYLYIQFSDDPNFSEYLATSPWGLFQEVAMVPRAGRYMRIAWQSYSTTGTYQYKISAVVVPFPVYPFAGSSSSLSFVPVVIRGDGVALAKSTDIPVPYRFAQTYSVAAGGNIGRISIDLSNYKECSILIFQDQNTTVLIEGSRDNSTWKTIASESGTAGTPYQKTISPFPPRYLGLTITNNGTAPANIDVFVIASKF